jgi:dihydrofolate reductase
MTGGEDMRKLVVWNLMTLDGYFEGTKAWDIDFHHLAWGPELEAYSEQFGEEGDLLVFGRKTYEGMAAYWTTAEGEEAVKAYMNRIAKIAVSRTMTTAEWNNTPRGQRSGGGTQQTEGRRGQDDLHLRQRGTGGFASEGRAD